MQIKRPILDGLAGYASSGAVSFHVPGHKGSGLYREKGIGFYKSILDIDLTEIEGTDNLYCPTGIIEEAQCLTARVYGVDYTYFLVNGSTGGVLAALLSSARPGDSVIVDRCCHSSVLNGLMLGRLRPVYLTREVDRRTGIPLSVDIEELERLLRTHDARAVILTSPNYYGICLDIGTIAGLVRGAGALLIVDEAHGAHLKFCDILPESAVDAGADIVIQSAHKTLPAMTQASWLHVNGDRVNRAKLERMLGVFQTTSPSYPLMASLDVARHIMATEGPERLRVLVNKVREVRDNINGMGNGLFLPDREYFKKAGCYDYDETRLVINCSRAGITGQQLDLSFREEWGIFGEMYDLANWVGVTTIGNRQEDFERLVKACSSVKPSGREIKLPFLQITCQPSNMNLWETMELEWEKVLLEKGEGRIAAANITPYPPGVPLVCPGERITKQAIEQIKDCINLGIAVKGYYDGYINIVKISNKGI